MLSIRCGSGKTIRLVFIQKLLKVRSVFFDVIRQIQQLPNRAVALFRVAGHAAQQANLGIIVACHADAQLISEVGYV